MLYHVIGENIDPGYMIPVQQLTEVIGQAVVPSFQMLASLTEAGKVTGGIFAGERGGAFIIDADSPGELDHIMNHLPFFGLIKWQVKPLIPFAEAAENVAGYMEDVRQMVAGAGQQ